jgi:amino acid transporter
MSCDKSAPPVSAAGAATTENQGQPHLRRVLGLRDLVFYGIVLVQPVGVIGPFGLADRMSRGHVTMTIVLGLVAMMFTAASYGRMGALYPAAGSAYTYVGRGLNPHLGFLAGWVMILDYLIIPIMSLVYAALSVQRLVDDFAPGFNHQLAAALGAQGNEPRVSFVLWVVLLTVAMTLLNLRGIKWTARTNQILLTAMCLMIAAFVVQAIRYLWARQGWAGLLSTQPLYNPRTFNVQAVCTATSLAVLTYIGFDGVTTLAEDVKNPKRTVPLAIMLTCLFIGLCAALQAYLGQRVWPDYTTFKNEETAFFDVCALVGGKFLFNAVSVIMAVACLGSALTGQVGAARILFAMGRDGALPKFFARLDKRNTPVLSIWLLGVLTLAGTLWLDYERAATLSNFGAFVGFMGVNLAVIRVFFFQPPAGHKRSWLWDLLSPGLGFLFCVTIWVSLPTPAKVLGTVWCVLGLIYAAINTRGFRKPPVMFDLNGA